MGEDARKELDAAKERLAKAERAYGSAHSELIQARDWHDRLLMKWFQVNYGEATHG